MSWFKRRRESAYRPMIFATDEAVQGERQRTAAAGLTFKYVEERERKRWITYSGTDPEKAKAFLRKEPVANDRTYIVVETEDGTWGTDSNSLYLEKLRPWQLNIHEADCEGSLESLVDGYHNYLLAARGIIDNFLVTVACGSCGHEWIDGIRYNDETLVRCPKCRSGNRVDSKPLLEMIRVHE